MHLKIQSAKYRGIDMTYIKTCRLTIVIASIIMLLLLLSAHAHAQTTAPTMTVKKFVGENTTFLWDYLVVDEPAYAEFQLRWTDDLTKTTIILKSIPINLRTTAISAAFTPGFKFTYYNVVAATPATSSVSAPSNTVATERVGRPPTNLRDQ
jgi:hypothetical protein